MFKFTQNLLYYYKMITSMTGFGSAKFENEKFSVAVEVKSINSKSQDFSYRLPRIFQDKEAEMKQLLSAMLDRGKVSVNIDYSLKGIQKPKNVINPLLFKAYYDDLHANATALGLSMHEALRIVVLMPDVYEAANADDEAESYWVPVFECIKKAVAGCNEYRLAEGKSLEEMLRKYVHNILTNLDKVSMQDAERVKKVKDKFMTKLDEYVKNNTIDQNRLEQEMIYYIEKLDIEEEKIRLGTHLNYFIECIDQAEANGKKLGFITQEIGREINTIGSKANDATIQKWVVEMKEELEKIKEQCLNVL
ncbi:MAG: YicC/YloC family endoribonuclease [Cytophagales bacterium]|nr:YicC/YloC family endoribonuclease [Cytophagales bacterium]